MRKDRSFLALFWTQFFGALNDNFLKNALLMLVVFKGISLYGLSAPSLVAFGGGLFILPFFLFSPVSGQLGERFDKARIARLVKVAEIGIMLIATLGLVIGNYHILFFTLFLMGVHSSVFGPIKYSLIPDLVEKSKLVAANAAVETGTFLAILMGTVAGGVAIASENFRVIVPTALIVIAIIGYLFSRGIPIKGAAAPNTSIRFNPIPEIKTMYQNLSPQTAVWNSILGLSWFWFLGAAILSILPAYVKDTLHGTEPVATFFLTVFTVGVAAGSVLCEKLSFEEVEIGLVPFGSIALSFFLIDLCFATGNYESLSSTLNTSIGLSDFLSAFGSFRIIFDFAGISIASGLFTVPLYALIQARCKKEWLSRAIAMNNIVNALFMVVSAGFLIALYAVHVSLPIIFLILGLINFGVAIYIYMIVPEFTLRFLSWILTHIFYRPVTQGLENIPATGAAVLVCNHVSYIDWLLISGAIRRPIRFVMYYKFAEIPLLRYLFRQAHVIPIAGFKEDVGLMEKAFATVHAELQAGELVCIFPEGKLTHDGELDVFRSGVERILKLDSVPVIPMALHGLWGSLFSHKDGPPMLKAPRKLWSRIALRIDAPVSPSAATAEHLQTRVAYLLSRD